MEEQRYDFSSLFERSEGDYAGSLLERLFGGVIPYLQGTADDLGAGNWLSTIFGLFNTAGLLAVLIVTSYTIYTVIMDTASDGKVFGQRTDTKYTIMRTMAGLIAFVPVSGGYSLAQVAMLFLVLQGSALGDVVWTRTADAALRGQPLLAQPAGQSVNNFAIQGQFASAFDALVNGHLCAINANSIVSLLGGSSEPNLDKPMEAKSSEIIEVSPHNVERATGLRARLQHAIRFEDSSSSYAGRANFCGGVQNSAVIRQSLPGTTIMFADHVAAARVRAQFVNYVSTIDTLSNDARALALQIHEGQRDVPTIEDAARTAVRRATANYASGAATNLAFSHSEAQAVHDGLLADASKKGWLFAPAWQRGISMGSSWYGSPDGDLRLQAVRENNLVEYLQGQGRRIGSRHDTVTTSMLAKASDDFETWDMMSPFLAGLSDPDEDKADEGTYSGLTQQKNSYSRVLNWLYQSMLDLFTPIAADDDGFGYVDPMVSISKQGQSLMQIGGVLAGGGALASGLGSFLSWVPGAGKIAGALGGELLETVGGAGLTAGVAFAFLGFVIGTLVPMIPFGFYIGAVISWVILVVESMFAVPLAVLSLFAPAREGSLIGSWNRILLSIFGIFFRPFFTVVGLIFAMMLMSFSLRYLYDLFYILMEFMVPSETVWSIFMMLGFASMYVMLTCIIVLLSAQLITELGDGAMNWLGVTFSASSKFDVGGHAQTAASLGTDGGLVAKASLASPSAQAGMRTRAFGAMDRLRRIRGTHPDDQLRLPFK